MPRSSLPMLPSISVLLLALLLLRGVYGRPDVQDRVHKILEEQGHGTFLVTFCSADLAKASSPLAMYQLWTAGGLAGPNRANDGISVSSLQDELSPSAPLSPSLLDEFVEKDYFTARGSYVLGRISEHHQRTREQLDKVLTGDSGDSPMRKIISSIPISNSFLVQADRWLMDLLAKHPDVVEIHSNESFQVDLPNHTDPLPSSTPPAPPKELDAPYGWIPGRLASYFGLLGSTSSISLMSKNSANTVQWNIRMIGASDVWELDGVGPRTRGQGVLYAIADTGATHLHPILRANYAGLAPDGRSYNHNYAWWDGVRKPVSMATNDVRSPKCPYASTAPCDDNGHGTHALSTAIGSSGYGVAPGARWIACRNMDSGVGRPETYLACLNFFLAPHDLNGRNPRPDLRPHVIGNSYGCPDSEGCSKHALSAAVEALRAAGIFMSVSAGNDGPECSTINDPPAVERSAIVVAAVDANDNLADFSSRGPVKVGPVPFRKPDLAAPGVLVLAAYPPNNYKRLSGTSMASPHVSGAAILMTALCPCIERNVDKLQYFLQMSAIAKKPPKSASGKYCGGDTADSIPNNYFGYGRIDVLAAVNVCRAYCRTPAAKDATIGVGSLTTPSGTASTTPFLYSSSSSSSSFSDSPMNFVIGDSVTS